MQLRWDHANLEMYRHLTGLHLQSVLSDLMDLESLPAIAPIAVDQLYARVVDFCGAAPILWCPRVVRIF